MKTQVTALEAFANLVGQAPKAKNSTKEVRVVNGTTYFRSCYSKRWFTEANRSGSHNYSKQDIRVWNSIYYALRDQVKAYKALQVVDSEAAKKLYDELDAKGVWVLWNAKDTDVSLYANTGGFTDAELDALEKDTAKTTAKTTVKVVKASK